MGIKKKIVSFCLAAATVASMVGTGAVTASASGYSWTGYDSANHQWSTWSPAQVNGVYSTGQSPQTRAENNYSAAQSSRVTGIQTPAQPTGYYVQSPFSQACERVCNFFGYRF